MNRSLPALLVILVAMAMILIAPATVSGNAAVAVDADYTSLSWDIRGFNFPSWWHDEYLGQASSDSLTHIAATGANWVAINPTQFMDTVNSDTIAPENGGAGRTATDAAVIKAIDDAHARGLKVMLKPHIDISDETTRWDIQPAHPALWFASYKSMIRNYASIAEAHHVELLAVGTELVTMSGANYYSYWEDMIGGVRAAYHGPLTYAGSTTECDYLSFAGLLDYLGLDVYFPLSDNAEPTLEELMAGWTSYHGSNGAGDSLASIEQWQALWDKPVIFTELGYRSVKYVGLAPWDWSSGAYDGLNQARAYEAAFRVLGDKSWLAGVFWWDWMVGEDTGGPGNTDYTIVNKPAEDVVQSWYALGQPQEPSVSASLGLVGWHSFADYQARNLSVDYQIHNSGSGQAVDVIITESHATAGVQAISALPVTIGSLDAGSGGVATITYRVPSGIASFRAFLDVTYLDSGGTSYHFPGALLV